MYAAGAEHPLREPCRKALERAVASRIALVTDAEVLQELLHRYFAIDKPEVARSVYQSTTRLCDEILQVGETHTARALELLMRHRRLSPRDAIHIATMESRGLRRLLSTDQDFDGISEVIRIDPARFPS